MLKAKHDGKVNREEVPESREGPSPRAKTWLWDSGKKGGTGRGGGGCIGLEKIVRRWAGVMRCQASVRAHQSLPCYLMHCSLMAYGIMPWEMNFDLKS